MVQQINDIIDIEIENLLSLKQSIDCNFIKVVNSLLANEGKTVFFGIGKSGYIAEKTASTFSSIGIPSIYLNATNALHGELGLIQSQDEVIYFSKSGETSELLEVAKFVNKKNCHSILITNNTKSSLGHVCDILIDLNLKEELDIYKILPTSSTTLMNVVGNILTVLLTNNNLNYEYDYAQNHPKGAQEREIIKNM